MIYEHKDGARATMAEYSVRAFPTFIILDSEGNEEMRNVGAPFATVNDALEWFPSIVNALENIGKYEAAHKEDEADIDAALKLAKVYNDLGRTEEAQKLFESSIESLEADDERLVDARLGLADTLMGTITRTNQVQVLGRILEIHAMVVPGLVEAKDERAIEPGIFSSRIMALLNNEFDEARDYLTNMIAAFSEHEKVWEMRTLRALYAERGGDAETAAKEYRSIIADAEEQEIEDNEWVKAAKQQLEAMEE
jgi:tetratricopeptide (TPR) repeat protein